jgi:hypothetical protein
MINNLGEACDWWDNLSVQQKIEIAQLQVKQNDKRRINKN